MRCDLFAVDARPTVRVDGADYELRLSSDFTLEEHRLLERVGPRAMALLARETVDEAEATALQALVDTICRLAWMAPASVLRRLSDAHRLAVAESALQALRDETPVARSASGETCAWDELAARLSRFYGGTPSHYLREIPIGELRRAIVWMERLTAEESMRAATRIGVGVGSLASESSRRVRAAWDRAAGHDRPRSTRPAAPPPGIGIRRAKVHP